MEFLELAKERYSCRKFKDQSVEPYKIDQIIEAAIAAPTAKNLQPWKIWVIKSPDAIEKLKQANNFNFGAKVILAVGAKTDEGWVRPSDQRNFADVDAAIVGTHIMLEVQALGLGATWVGYFDAPKLKELFPEMADYDLVALFPIGYPAIEPHERHFQRKPKYELVEYI